LLSDFMIIVRARARTHTHTHRYIYTHTHTQNILKCFNYCVHIQIWNHSN